MQKKKMRNSVYTELLINERGVTLINSLLRILIIALTLPILLYVFQKLHTNPLEETLSIEQLFIIMQKELYDATEVSHTDNKISLKVNNKMITFTRYGRIIRRQVDHAGHEIYHRDIVDFAVKSVTNGLLVTITTSTGGVYERVLIKNG